MNTYSVYVSILLVTISTGYLQCLSQPAGSTVSYNGTKLPSSGYGTDDTISNATDKGGNQVNAVNATIVLQGMLILYNNHQY